MKRIYIDTETTGTDPKKHGIIQISGMIEIDGEIKEEFNYRLQPFPVDIIEDEALQVNGVTREQLDTFEHPRKVYIDFAVLLAKYVDKFSKTDKFSFVAYNATFDFDMLRAFFMKNGDSYFGSWFFSPPICLMQKAAYALESERHLLPNFKLSTVSEFLQIDISDLDFHEAMSDVKAMMRVEEKLNHR